MGFWLFLKPLECNCGTIRVLLSSGDSTSKRVVSLGVVRVLLYLNLEKDWSSAFLF